MTLARSLARSVKRPTSFSTDCVCAKQTNRNEKSLAVASIRFLFIYFFSFFFLLRIGSRYKFLCSFLPSFLSFCLILLMIVSLSMLFWMKDKPERFILVVVRSFFRWHSLNTNNFKYFASTVFPSVDGITIRFHMSISYAEFYFLICSREGK